GRERPGSALLVEDDDDRAILPISRRRLYEVDVLGQPQIPGRAIVAIVGHIGCDERKVRRRLHALKIGTQPRQRDDMFFAVGEVVVDGVKPDEVVVLGQVGVIGYVVPLCRAGTPSALLDAALAHVLLVALPTQATGLKLIG